jgi:hypothetical protein
VSQTLKCGECLQEIHPQGPIDYMGTSVRHKHRGDCFYAIRAESKQREELIAIKLANLTADLRQLESTANNIWRNQQMSTQSVASGLLDLIVKFVDHALLQIDSALGMKPYVATEAQRDAVLVPRAPDAPQDGAK